MIEVLHNSTGDNEHVFSSTVPFFEVFTGIEKSFTTTLPNQLVYIDVQLPFTVLRNAAGPTNGTFRLYLDGTAQDAADGKQWNGWLVGHGSGWQTVQNTPATGMPVSVHQWVQIEEPGEHRLRLQFASSTTDTCGTLRSRQFWQIWTIDGNGGSQTPPSDTLLNVTEISDATAISSNTPNVELTREIKTFVSDAGAQVSIDVTAPVKYCKVGGPNASGAFRLYLDDILIAQQSGPLISVNSTLNGGPWFDGASLSYSGVHTLAAGTHNLALRYSGDSALVCGVAKAGRRYQVTKVV